MASEGKMTNCKWVLEARPNGKLKMEDLKYVEEPVDLATYEVPEGKALIKVEMLSADAFLRTMLEDGAFHGTIPLGGTIPALGYGKVIKSPEGGLPIGTRVGGMVFANTLALMDVVTPGRGGTVWDPEGIEESLPGMGPEARLGLFGLTTGLAAYAGVMLCLKAPEAGETCVVSAACGAVGNLAAQLCKSRGARVIGIAGGTAKCEWLRNTLKLDGAVDYKDTTTTLGEQLDKLCPDGVNFFFDNVGGDILDEVLMRITQKARVVLCGGISQYERAPGTKMTGPSNYLELAKKNSQMAGFVVTQYAPHFEEAKLAMKTLHEMGSLQVFETRKTGIQEFPAALQGLFNGTTFGKTLVQLPSWKGRKPIVGGNWKCNPDKRSKLDELLGYIGACDTSGCDVYVCPSTLHVSYCCGKLKNGALVTPQNMNFKGCGAFTGEMAVEQMKDMGLSNVLIGHSERRGEFGIYAMDNNATLAQKLKYALDAGMTAVFCIGEPKPIREQGLEAVLKEMDVQLTQIYALLDPAKVVVAYEPVWAIGTGLTASPQDAQDTHAGIRKLISEKASPAVAEAIRIQYGGSANAANAGALSAMPDIDGFLVGGASLKPEFKDIVAAISSAKAA